MAKKGIKIGACLLVLGVGGYVAKVWLETPRVESITLYDRDSKQAFDAFTGQPTNVPNEFAYTTMNETHPATQKKINRRVALIKITQPRGKFFHYRSKLHDQVMSGGVSYPNDPGLRTSALMEVEIPSDYPDNSFPLQVSYLDRELEKVWSGKKWENSDPVSWSKLTDFGVVLPLAQVKGMKVDEPDDGYQIVFFDEENRSNHFGLNRPQYADHWTTSFHERFNRVWLGVRSYKAMFNGDVAFGENPSQKKHLPSVEMPVVAALIEKPLPSNIGEPVDGWTQDGTPISCLRESALATQLAPPRNGNFRLVRVRFKVPKFPDFRPYAWLFTSLPNSRLLSRRSWALPERVGSMMEFQLEIPSDAAVADLKLVLPTSTPTLKQTLKSGQSDQPTDSTYGFQSIDHGHGYFTNKVLVSCPSQDLVHIIARLDSGYEYCGGGEYGQTIQSLDFHKVDPKEIKEVEVWTYPTKTYTFKNVALKPRP